MDSRECSGGPFALTVPIRLGRGQNDRFKHWGAAKRKHDKHRNDVHLLWPWQWRARAWAFPVTVKLIRISRPSATGWKPLDDDNLRASFKQVRDQVAQELHVNDGDRKRVLWLYDDEEGPWGIRIEIQEGAP